MFRITLGLVISNPAPHTEHGANPGLGGVGRESAGANVMGAAVGPDGASVTGDADVHPHGPATKGRRSQKYGSTKPSCPANSKFPHVTGNCPGIFKMTLGNVTTIPSPHTKQGG
mmetsp:Transcript_10296/g.23799  ORF Transcript_10296/g.23799 Transcript_10296/m.23799 type:complete len:114 (+) Transcript_10296:698-1039(+)